MRTSTLAASFSCVFVLLATPTAKVDAQVLFRGFAGQTTTSCDSSDSNLEGDASSSAANETLVGGSIGRFTGPHFETSLGLITNMCAGVEDYDSRLLTTAGLTLYPIAVDRFSLGVVANFDVDFSQMGETLRIQSEGGEVEGGGAYLFIRPEATASVILFGFGDDVRGGDGELVREGLMALDVYFGRYRNRSNYAKLALAVYFNQF